MPAKTKKKVVKKKAAKKKAAPRNELGLSQEDMKKIGAARKKLEAEFKKAKKKLEKAEKDMKVFLKKNPKKAGKIAAGVGAVIAAGITAAVVKHKKKK